MQALLIVVNILLVIVALVLIVAVLMQQGNTANLGAISGGAETFFGKNKAKSYEGKLALITKICAGLFIVLAITATALTSRMNNSSSNVAPVSPIENIELDATVAPEEATAAPEATVVPEVTEAPAAAEEVPAEAEATPVPAE